MAELKYKRVLLKLSGEALAGNQKNGVDAETVGKICDKVKEIVDLGVQVAIVVGGKEIKAEDLDFIHENKTGAFLILSVRIGAMLADANSKDLEKLTNYAKKIGLAFQVKDDILSEEGNEKILGKPVGNDKKLKKCTYVSKYGLEKAKEILNQIIEDSIKEIAEYGEKATFLIELSRYIANRNK